MGNKKIAILGATGHIAKGLISGFATSKKYELFLFARSLDRLSAFLAGIKCNAKVSLRIFSELNAANYDVIINCVGISGPKKVKNAGVSIFRVAEIFDNMVLDYLENHPKALYINLSSGAVYGTEFDEPVSESSCNKLYINRITPQNFYGIAKINSEAKHRSMNDRNIVDLRLFGYFSRFIDLGTEYFMTEIISCIKQKKEFMTDPENMVRDFVHPKDLMSLIEKCISKRSLNDAFDVYSLKPATKFEILDYFSKEYGLKYRIDKKFNIPTATGTKTNYYSNNKKAAKIGYSPKFTAMDTIVEETKAILSR